MGVLLPREAPLVAWLGDYAASRQFDSFRSWLADGKEPGFPTPVAPAAQPAPTATARTPDPVPEAAPTTLPEEDADEEPVRFIILPLLLGLVVAFVATVIGVVIMRRRRS